MGRDKLITPKINEVHPRFATPYRAIGITGALILVFLIFGNLELLATAGSVLHLIVYGLLNIALIVFREANPKNYEPDFEVPLYPIVPVLGAVFSFALIVFIEPFVILLTGLLVGFSVLWYLGYSRLRVEQEGVFARYVLKNATEFPDAAVSATQVVQPDKSDYRVMVPLANPAHETDLISVGASIADDKDGTVVAVNIVQVPDQTSLEAARGQYEHDAAHHLLEQAQEDVDTYGVPVETHVVLSHEPFEEIFNAASRYGIGLTVMGWGPETHGLPGRAESMVDELAHTLPSDLLVFKDQGFDPSRILVPTAGGPHSGLAATIAKTLAGQFESTVTLLHVAEEQEEGEKFLESWAERHDLGTANLQVVTGGVEEQIKAAAKDATLIVIGSTKRGVLSRLVHGSFIDDILEAVECSVLLAEKRENRTLKERLLGKSTEPTTPSDESLGSTSNFNRPLPNDQDEG